MDLPGLFQNNIRLKLVSLLLATGIWYSIHFFFLPARTPGDPGTIPITTTRIMEGLQVQVKLDADNVSPMVVDPLVVDAEVRGPKDLVQSLREEDIDIYLDLSQIRLSQGIQKKLDYRVRYSSLEIQLSPESVSVNPIHDSGNP